MISRSLERPERTARCASDANNRNKIRYTRLQDRPAFSLVDVHGPISDGTHTASVPRYAQNMCVIELQRRGDDSSGKSFLEGSLFCDLVHV